jgi:hypothetical protein
MERFWGNIKTSRQRLCHANLIKRTIFEYHQHRIHSAFDCTPAQSRDQRDYRGTLTLTKIDGGEHTTHRSTNLKQKKDEKN